MSTLAVIGQEARSCTRCELAASRTQVVFGAGDPSADLMFVGEAPGAAEDLQGLPFVGASGRMLAELLAGIGLARDDVYITNVLRCRPPDNRDPRPAEINACSHWLFQEVSLVQPRVVASLGGFATQLLSGRMRGISRCHGEELELRLGSRLLWLYPLYHPAAGLYAPSLRTVLKADFARIPELLERELAQPDVEETEESAEQLGLFQTSRGYADEERAA